MLKSRPPLITLNAPVKVFGDIHGQYKDLMRFFDLWGMPDDADGDIESYDYLFLGDYVDRGSHQLETVCLLMALKIKFPDKMHLLRGNHEDRTINCLFGFGQECKQRLGENVLEENSVFNRVNDVFDWLPLTAVIDDEIICVHGGIGSSFINLAQVARIERPLAVAHEVNTLLQ